MDMRKIRVYYGVIPLLSIAGAVISGAGFLTIYSLLTKKDVSLWNRPWQFSDPPASFKFKKAVHKPAESQAHTELDVE